MICTESIKKSYGSKEIVKGISMNVNKGEIFSLLGPNGTGKSTTIRLLTLLISPDSGTIKLLGKSASEHAREIRSHIGYVGQDTERSGYARLTVRENLQFFSGYMGMNRTDTNKAIQKWSDLLNCSEILDRRFTVLSGGQKQLMVIMRALLHEPDLLFFDEPTKGLDPVKADYVRSTLAGYVKEEGKALILTSHIMKDVEDMSDQVAFLRDGKIAFTDKTADIYQLLGYQMHIQVKSKGNPQALCRRLLKDADIVYTNTDKSPFVEIGTNDVLRLLDVLRQKEDWDADSFSIHETSIEDAYLYFSSQPAADCSDELLNKKEAIS